MSDWGSSKPSGPKDWTVVERFLLTELEDRRRASRWRFFRRAVMLLIFAMVVANVLFGKVMSSKVLVPHIAVIKVDGMIAAGAPTNADSVSEALQAAFEAKEAKAVVLQINSPGGSPVQSDLIFRELQRLRAATPDKPVYAVIGDVGASGAYYIAVGAEKIFVNPASLVGSIGVVMPNYGVPDLIKKLGIEDRTLTAGENKNLLSPTAPVNAAEREHVQSILDAVHRQFIQAVKTGRGERLVDHPKVFSGYFWDGEEAIRLGLADGVASLRSLARDEIKLNEFVDYTIAPDPFEKLFRGLGVSLSSGVRQGLGLSGVNEGLR
ncbi:MAG: signal peptide peptidase SppA [Acinetobacter sp.]|nr:signal peptide peptidase SppA [Acinetobacter sp.]MDO9620954.1 signal peptide peptidase SppA [Moraxellaceae bacterium]